MSTRNNELSPYLERYSTFCYYDSVGLLPLCWAEVYYSRVNNIRTRICPYCGKIFEVPLNNPWKHFCQDKVCKQAYVIEKHGGIEGYREWERTRKKSTGGKRGRPKNRFLTSSLTSKKIKKDKKSRLGITYPDPATPWE